MTQIIKSIDDWKSLNIDKQSLGLIPTMGALHKGHLSLVKRSIKENSLSAVSIFVNPTQFNDPGDYQGYPQTWEQDIAKLKDLGIEYIFAPRYQDLYPDDYRYQICENKISDFLCGAHRPGHFTGVLTVVMKLLLIIQPTRAYFGKKDYQQYLLIKDMVKSFFLDMEIIGCEIVRELDFLAMSSRNLLLDKEQRKKAPQLYQILTSAKSPTEAKNMLEEVGFKVDYVEDKWKRRLAAAYIGNIRLIDNVEKL